MFVVASLAIAACSGSGNENMSASDTSQPSGATTSSDANVPALLIEAGRVTDETLAAAVDGTEVNGAVIEALDEALMALPETDRLAVATELSRRLELELARISGLEEAVGGPAATEAAIDGAWAAIAEPGRQHRVRRRRSRPCVDRTNH